MYGSWVIIIVKKLSMLIATVMDNMDSIALVIIYERPSTVSKERYTRIVESLQFLRRSPPLGLDTNLLPVDKTKTSRH